MHYSSFIEAYYNWVLWSWFLPNHNSSQSLRRFDKWITRQPQLSCYFILQMFKFPYSIAWDFTYSPWSLQRGISDLGPVPDLGVEHWTVGSASTAQWVATPIIYSCRHRRRQKLHSHDLFNGIFRIPMFRVPTRSVCSTRAVGRRKILLIGVNSPS